MASANQSNLHRPRVMLFTDSFIFGGTERQFVRSLAVLEREKYEVLVGCLQKHGPFLQDVAALGIPVHEFPARPPSVVRWLLRFAALVRFFRRERIDLVHAFDFYSDVFVVPAARLAGVPAVISSRREVWYDRTPWRRLAMRVVSGLSTAVVANSRVAADTMRTRRWFGGEPDVTIIPNCIDLEALHPDLPAHEVRRRLGLAADAPLAGHFAALRPEKDVETFLRAAKQVSQEEPRAQFLVIGDGSERPRLEALGHQLGLNGTVHFVGSRRDVGNLLSALDVFVLSSKSESCPNTLLEAMALGRAVVSTRTGGIPEFVREGETGCLVELGDERVMAQRILTLLRDPGARQSLGEAARAHVAADFSPAAVKQRLTELYDRVLARSYAAVRVLLISNYPPPMDGWAIHVVHIERELRRRGVDCRVMDIGPSRKVGDRGCVTVRGGFDYFWKLVRFTLRGFLLQPHVNGDSWKGYTLAFLAVLLGRLAGRPVVLMFHAGPSQMYFPRTGGYWHHAFRLLFQMSGQIICNSEPVKQAILGYGVSGERVHPVFSVNYSKLGIPAPLPAAVEGFLARHEPRLFSYSLFRPEFTMAALFDAFAELRREFPRAGLLIAGPAETPPEFAQQIERLGLRDCVYIPGNLPREEFLTAVQRSDVFVRTHLRDGVCSSVLEALTLGVPVVAAEDGIRPPSVVTYAPGDAADMLRKLRGVLADLPAARAAVHAPAADNQLEREMDVILRAARGEGVTPAMPQTGEARG